MKRTFIAIDIEAGPKLIEDFEMVRYRLRLERINWVPIGNLHLTLYFLGDTEEELLSDIPQVIGNIANKIDYFELTLRSFGVFKNLRDPRVLWFGIDHCDLLYQIKKELDLGLSDFGFIPETRPFSPHLTLGRVKVIRQQNQLVQLITLFKEIVIQNQLVTKLTFYESKLSPDGPIYIPLYVAPFKIRHTT